MAKEGISSPIYDCFRRDDSYGAYGEDPLPTLEFIRLWLFAIFVVPFKALGVILCVLGCFLVCKVSVIFPKKFRGGIIATFGKLFSRLCLLSFGFTRVKWVKQQADPETQVKNQDGPAVGGIVSNHLGWTDILVHMSHSFPSFVARDGTQKLPFVGIVSQCMDCIYVTRENKSSITQGVASTVRERMDLASRREGNQERPMLLFPEGTTSNGRFLLPFKTGAFLAGAPVLPVVLKYGKGRVSVCWESISAPRHIFLLLCNPFHSVVALELPVYYPSEAEKKDPVLYASNVRNYMLKHGGLKASTAGLNDKRTYHAMLKGEPLPMQKKKD